MKNIFASAKFGDKFQTRDGRMAIYWRKLDYYHRLISDELKCSLIVKDDGRLQAGENHSLDIVSEWLEPVVIKCQWKDYYDYRIMMPNGEGHVRVSFFSDEIIISDLYVVEEHRHKGYASILLNKVDELLNGKVAVIHPLEEWHIGWYKRRGYVIGNEEPINENININHE